MKAYVIVCAAAMALCSAGCSGWGGRELSDFKDATPADSLLYYYAQLRAYEYWQHADADTSMRSLENRKEFLEGIRAGLKAVAKERAAYNNGVRLGVRMGMKLREFEALYGIDGNPDVLYGSIANGLERDKDLSAATYQEDFYAVLDGVKSRQRKNEKDLSRHNLIGLARERGLTKDSDDLYYRLVSHGTGPKAQEGDRLHLTVDYIHTDGEYLGIPAPEVVTVGAPGVPDVMDRVYRKMAKGSTGLFATTAESLFGYRTGVLAMKPSDIVLVSVTVNDIETPDSINDPVWMPE